MQVVRLLVHVEQHKDESLMNYYFQFKNEVKIVMQFYGKLAQVALTEKYKE